MVYFEGNLLIDQVQGHHNMLEQIVHNFAGAALVFASLISILIIRNNFKGSKIGWPAITGGLLSVSFIGLGDAAEHLLPGINPLPHETLHYLHMIGGPVALFLLYVGLREYTSTTEVKPLAGMKLFLIILATLLIPLALATQANQRWDPDIEGPFLLITAVPTVIIALMVLRRARSSFDEHSTVVLNISFVAIGTTLLTLSLLAARMGDVELLDHGMLYVYGHAMADVFHAITAATVLMFGITTEELIRSM